MFKTDHLAARRAGMLAGGLTLLVFDLLIVQALLRRDTLAAPTGLRVHELLLLMWPAAVGVGGMTAAVAMPWLRAERLRVAGTTAGRLAGVLATALRWPAVTLGRVRETTAFALPAVAAALALPLTIHLVYFVAVDGELNVRQFSEWARAGVAFTCIAHVWFAGCVGRRAAQIARGEEPLRVWTVYWSTVLMSAFPGVVLFGLPPLITAVTGIPVLPLLHLMKRYGQVSPAGIELPLARVLA